MADIETVQSIGRCVYRFDGIPPIHPREFEIQGYEVEVIYGREWISVVTMAGGLVKLPGNEWRIELWADEEPEPEDKPDPAADKPANDIVPTWDGEGFPPEGATVLIKHRNATNEWAQPDFHPMKIVARGRDLVIFADMNGNERYGKLADYEYKPIPPEVEQLRIEIAQSLCDAVSDSQIPLNEALGIGTDYFKLTDAILAGKIKHVHVE